jgi:hypothetical protein
MWRLHLATAVLLLGCNAGLAQVSTMGTTAMGLSSTPGAIVTSPLNGPSPFSATTQPAVPDTTLAPVPLASDPTTPGTVVTCTTPTGQITTPAVPVTSLSAIGTTIGTVPSVSAASTISALPSASSVSSTYNSLPPPLALSAQPATSFMSDFPGSTIPAPQPPGVPPLPSPSMTPVPAPVPLIVPSTLSNSMPGTTAMMASPTTGMPSTPLGTIPAPIVITATGNIPPTIPLGAPSTTSCSTVPGGPPTNGAALPLSTPAIPANPPPGTIQPVITEFGGTSINPTMTVVPTPDTSACAESTTMNLSTPGTMAPANATGAAATPGVSPPGC